MSSLTTYAVITLIFLACLLLIGCADGERGGDRLRASDTPADASTAPAETAAERPRETPVETPAPADPPAAAEEQEQTFVPEPVEEQQFARVNLQTSMGLIVLELDGKLAPITTTNFLNYVERGFYDGTIFHRIIPGFVIQGGGHLPDMTQKQTDAPIRNEWRNGLKNVRGSISMARLGNQPDSATSQFFINLVDNNVLDQPRDGAAYAVFGRVVEGMDVVDKIATVETTRIAGQQDVPAEPILIERAYRGED